MFDVELTFQQAMDLGRVRVPFHLPIHSKSFTDISQSWNLFNITQIQIWIIASQIT